MRRTGHIRERSPGSWELRYSLGTNPATGKRRVATTTVEGSRKDAEIELRRLLRTVDTGETVAEWLATWLAAVREEVSPKTHERYAEIVGNFLVPELGGCTLQSLHPPISKWLTQNWPSGADATERQAACRRKPAGIFTAFFGRPYPAPSNSKSSLAIRPTPLRSGSPRWNAAKW